MRVRKRKEVVAKSKAALALRRQIGWTRARWINEVESALAEAFVLFAQARLALRNGQRRHVRVRAADFERLLSRRVIDIFVHPVKREFDRKAAFEEAVREMTPGTIPALREHFEREVAQHRTVRRGLEDRDVEEFWRRTREATRVLRGEARTGRERGRGDDLAPGGDRGSTWRRR